MIEHALEVRDVEFAACCDVARLAQEDPATPRRPLTPLLLEPGLYPE